MVLVGLGLGLSNPVFNVISLNAVPRRLVSSATSALQFIRQIGATLGLAVARCNLRSELQEQPDLAMTPAQQARAQDMFGDTLFNPQKLFDLVPPRLASAPPRTSCSCSAF